jgi:D-sedoheptulose 7-phosphate isomerase
MATTATGEVLIQGILAANIQVHEAMREDAELIWGIWRAAKMITQALGRGNRLLIIGNGGSAAEAQHLAAEFVGRHRIERQALPALALTGNTSTLTAIGNDYGFEDVFTRQVEAFAEAGDVLMCISTSGKSRNILRAALLAGALRVKTIGLTGEESGKLPKCVDLCLRVPSAETPRIQEAHAFIIHAIAEIVENDIALEPELGNAKEST